jgi:hypothetical protein
MSGANKTQPMVRLRPSTKKRLVAYAMEVMPYGTSLSDAIDRLLDGVKP